MYSVVLMAALTTGGEAPAWFGHGCGCHGAAYAWGGCYGCVGGYGGCWGGYGAGGWSGYGAGGGGGGCYGGGCFGGYAGNCYGGSYGGFATGDSWGGWGSCYGGCFGGAYGCHGGYGCSGCYGCYGGGVPAMATTMPYSTMPGAGMPGAGMGTPEIAPPPKAGGTTGTSLVPANKARLVVDVPAGGKLYVDDQPIDTRNGGRRVFSTPELQKGNVYYYEVRVEVVRDGQKFADTKRVLLKGGQEAVQSFADLGKTSGNTATASAR